MIQERNGFHIGDRVEFVANEDPDGRITRGMLGTVHTLEMCYKGCIGVKWDTSSKLGALHSFRLWCGKGVPSLDENLGWWVPPNQISIVDDLQINNTDLDEMMEGLYG